MNERARISFSSFFFFFHAINFIKLKFEFFQGNTFLLTTENID